MLQYSKIITCLLVGCIIISGCSSKRGILLLHDNMDSFEILEDHVDYTHKSKIGVRLDSEEYSPVSFHVKLPKDVKFLIYEDALEFKIGYANQEYIFILTDILGKFAHRPDTVYIPTTDELAELLFEIKESPYMRGRARKYNIRNIKERKHRRNLLFVKQGEIIVLYNIKLKNIDNYRTLVESFQIIDN